MWASSPSAFLSISLSLWVSGNRESRAGSCVGTKGEVVYKNIKGLAL